MTVGFYGGKFLPLHLGHVYAIIQASTMVDELYVVLSHSENRDKELCKNTNIDYIESRVRFRWLHQLVKDMEHVKVLAVEDSNGDKDYNWHEGAFEIKRKIGKPIDYVFSSERAYEGIFANLYPHSTHIIIDGKREMVPISATKIRENGVFQYWDFLPDVVKPHFVKKVVVLGTESCGKSTLTRNLAKIFNTTFVEEYGRTFCEKVGGCEGIMLEEDYPLIAYHHKVKEAEAIEKANKIVFIDTEAVVTQFYSELYNGSFHPILDEMAKNQNYDLMLYLEPDVKWVNDGLRVHGKQEIREENNQRLKMLLQKNKLPFIPLSGTYHEKLAQAVKEVRAILRYRK
ncbi:multifunctional transcriptional regulator/nicotinamide-nucleotide adenylyltransferase/ribosylnicotinamide kinase NadR [Mesobacillus maritimus]|uniref:multifunctional transcriptional regulator/nicotinamide-nucleotide adenylyltransferase/ribosylnicotinamide kinase NadR n=1 Tax=Mesobacillus maritimus TaxID=1643336 RepID=UPI00203C2B1B|nr:multifunctional transcriptional regulator/nicotinamide-nucleotide adenylyltransferase/ribosylnicotinamide kinase NadR [Mesobacillus maritimus]MCM3586641.1 multifunctional transcriptional regulator/nicotinamide-nucleotide adenylyltransferase/ribosylnicotinamide kinase NadR [Mesobacillus maritimus]MCM3668606.1 multifunctional transcriptional regulator/nicotinamide-nucleotide adenylyltransferase/ribosylnicotinamide kinase NadR [Mesobacillus maritimus]